MGKLRSALEKRLRWIVLVLVAVQPLLDVLSYFLSERGSNAISTLLRFGMLGAVALLGFLLSDSKKIYLALYAAVAVFWLAHALNNFRVGYISLVQDTANFLRILNFPIFALTIITVLQKDKSLRGWLYLGVAVGFGEMLLFTALPWVLGQPMYTYDFLQVGVMGWFAIPNAQAVILVLATPLAIFWAYRFGKYPVFLAALLVCFGLLYVTGTKFSFYSIFIIAGAYIFLFVLQMGTRSLKYALPLLALFVLCFAFRHQSPMALRERMSAYSQGLLTAMVEESLENSGADQETLELIKNEGEIEEEEEEEQEPVPVPRPEKRLERMRRALMGIYAEGGVYGEQLEDLNQRFGIYNVMQTYRHTDAPWMLSDFRLLKTNYAKLIWNEKDTLTRFLGLEYSDFLINGHIYDLENDFPAVYYGCGYLGFGLYLLFFAIFVLVVLRAFTGEVYNSFRKGWRLPGNPVLKTAGSFWQGLRSFLTIEVGAVGMSFLLALIAAQFSGYVLRRPNVTIYFAIAAACLFSLTAEVPSPPLGRLLAWRPKRQKLG